jgi:signal transduction histidine kinase
MDDKPIEKISLLGLIAIGMGAGSIMLYTVGSLITAQGTMVIPILILGLLLTFFSSFGYIELVLMYTNKSGGIAPACAEALKSYSPILTNVIGVGYWLAWIPAASYAALYAAQIIQNFIPWVSVDGLSSLLIITVAVLNCIGLKWVERFAIPIAAVAAFLTFLVVIIPLLTGQVNWHESSHYTLIAPFPNKFGALTSFMAVLYVIGWSVPAYECVLCYVKETANPQKNIPRAMFISFGTSFFYYGVLPLIWLCVVGPENVSKELTQILNPSFSPLLGIFAKVGVAWFIIFNMLIALFPPLCGPPRTIAQLSHDGLLPSFIGIPWVSNLLTTTIAILIVWFGAPSWLIAATNFQYLLCIALASIAVWLLRKTSPDAPRLYRAPNICIYLGLISASIWIIATVLGFRQYGLPTVIAGIVFAFSGIPFYLWRRISDRLKAGLSPISPSLHLKLTGTLISVLVIDAAGYLVAVKYIGTEYKELTMVLEDIFVLVALLTLTAGLIIPGMIIHAAEQVNNAARRIVSTNLKELSIALESLGRGKLDKFDLHAEIKPIHIHSHDEIGDMANSFNLMQEEILKTSYNLEEVRVRLKKAISDLKKFNLSLENKIADRTKELEKSNSQLKNEMDELEKAQLKISSLHNELLLSARQAGMAEIATSTLHNVGNVLNSVNISTEVIAKKIFSSPFDNLQKIADLFKKHEKDIAEFITKDDSGRYIPQYLIELAYAWTEDKKNLLDEINLLKDNILHIKNIISIQQSFSSKDITAGLTEEVSIKKLINDAIILNKSEKPFESIDIQSHYEPLKKIIIDRAKVLQIIVNLLKNSIEAMSNQASSKTIKIEANPIDETFFELRISDNGIGIAKENLTKIFSTGFTTKKDGHGYGLHTSALSAKELGGSLKADSKGLGHGATFTIVLPYQPINRER